MPKAVKVQSLAEAEDPDDPSAGPTETMVTIPDHGSDLIKAKYKGPVASPRFTILCC
ncbi:hypothetical protein VP01_9514g1 [Puccinia sorghi]|uniref:Uncharacterized protein n=1 Tax=Puccinia sorghi TaxID=27349 RepID=A0A0L6U6E7_9BASI|nr:hypothetical protein VP01_9514g1 [Puccinia sorghi]